MSGPVHVMKYILCSLRCLGVGPYLPVLTTSMRTSTQVCLHPSCVIVLVKTYLNVSVYMYICDFTFGRFD